MTQVHDEELSALLDGELDEREAARLRARIAADPALRREFEALQRVHDRLGEAAEQLAFMPDIVVPQAERPAVGAWMAAAAGVLALLAIRFLPKFVDLAVVGIAVQVAACAAIAFVVIRMARQVGPPATLRSWEGSLT
jgi:anti-sigma factor RsiW